MEFDIKQLAGAMKLIAEEKNLPEDVVQEIVESALAAAYKRDYGDREQEVRVSVNLSTGATDVYVEKEVVETIGDGNFEISLVDAKKVKKDAAIGEMLEQWVEVTKFGRVAAQTAKQVIMQLFYIKFHLYSLFRVIVSSCHIRPMLCCRRASTYYLYVSASGARLKRICLATSQSLICC